MDPAALGAVVLLLVTVVLVQSCWQKKQTEARQQRDASDDDGDAAELEGRALIDSERSAPKKLRWSRLRSGVRLCRFFGRKNHKPRAIKKMKVRSARKIHQPYFYPLLDETKGWWQAWENAHLPQHSRRTASIDESPTQLKALPIAVDLIG